MVVFGQKWFYSDKSGCFRVSGCIRAKWDYSGKVVVFEQMWLYLVKVFVFGQKLLYFGKSGYIRSMWFY